MSQTSKELIPKNKENKKNIHINGDLSGATLILDENVSDYNIFFTTFFFADVDFLIDNLNSLISIPLFIMAPFTSS